MIATYRQRAISHAVHRRRDSASCDLQLAKTKLEMQRGKAIIIGGAAHLEVGSLLGCVNGLIYLNLLDVSWR